MYSKPINLRNAIDPRLSGTYVSGNLVERKVYRRKLSEIFLDKQTPSGQMRTFSFKLKGIVSNGSF